MSRGFPLDQIDAWNTGDLIDWVKETERNIRRARGEDVRDPYEQYKTLKSMEPEIERMHASGDIREAKYKSYKQALATAEKQLKG